MILTFPYYHCDPTRIESTIDFILHPYIMDYAGTKIWKNKKQQQPIMTKQTKPSS